MEAQSYNLGNVGICVWSLLFYGGAVLWVSIPWQAYMVTPLAVEGGKQYTTTILAFHKVTGQSGKPHTTNFHRWHVFRWTAVVRMCYDLGLCGTPMSGIDYFIAEQYWEVSVQTTASGTTLCKTLLDCNGMEGSSSISSLGHWTMEAWVMNWVIWYIYEWCLLCHGGAVLRGGRNPIAALPNVAVQPAWWPPSSTSGSMTGPQWNRRSFFHFPH